MKTWLHKIKKISTICTFSATLGLPLLVLVSYLIGIREAYSNLKVLFPIHPYTVSLASVLPYLAVLYLAAYLFKKRHRLGEFGLLATVFIILTVAILIQAVLHLYIVSYR